MGMSNRGRYSGSVFPLAIALFMAVVHHGAAAIRYSGTLVHKSYKLGKLDAHQKILVATNAHLFEITVLSNKWRLRRANMDDVFGRKQGPKFMEIAFDGVDSYGITHVSDEIARNPIRSPDVPASVKVPGVSDFAFIEHGPPFGRWAKVYDRMLWLAFAADAFLAAETNREVLLPPFENLFFKYQRFKFRFSSNQQNGRLQRFEQYAPNDGIFKTNVISEEWYDLLPDTKSEYVAMKFEVRQFNTFQGIAYPMEFELEQYYPILDNNGRLEHIATGVTLGNVSKVEYLGEEFVLPSIPVNSQVHDSRFYRNEKGAPMSTIYASDNGKWLRRDDLEFEERLMSAVAHARFSNLEAPIGPKDYVTWLFLALLVGTAILFKKLIQNIRQHQS